jgi:signal peptidase I
MFGKHSWISEWLQALLISITFAFLIRVYVVEIFVVDGESMLPTLHDHDRLLVSKISYHFTKPEPGDVIVFRYPANPREDFIKRVIAVEGQIVEIRDGTVFINKHELKENYINGNQDDWGPEIVPQGAVFVLGDNRSRSRDSRVPDVGFVPIENVIGKAVIVIWPTNRFGKIKRK